MVPFHTLNQILIPVINFLAVAIGFLVYKHNPKGKVNRLLLIMVIYMLLWVDFAYIPRLIGVQNSILALTLLKIAWFATPLLFVFLYFLIIFLVKKEKEYQILNWLILGLGLFASYLAGFTNLVVENLRSVGPYLGINYGKAMLPFLGIVTFIMLATLFSFFREYFRSSPILKLKLQYLLVGIFLFYLANLVFNIALPLLFDIVYFYWIGDYSAIFLLGFASYAIVKRKLFGIKVLLTELLIGVMGIILLILPFLMPTTNLRSLTSFVFLLFLAFSYLLLKATYEEENRRRQAEELARQREELVEQFQVIAIRSQAIAKRAQEIAERERKLRKEIEQLMSAKEQFLLSVQHYFRTPLTSIIGYLEMINEGDYGLEKIPLVLKSALNLRKRIEESLDISAFQSGRAILQKEKVKVKDLIKQAIFETEIEAKKKNLYLKEEFPKEDLPEIEIDPKRMKEVFVNLIENGIKHTLKGGVRVGFKISIPPRHPKLKDFKESFLFWVKDTGIGMTKEEIESVGTSLFERGKRAKEISPMGKGLGLYLSRLIVQAHGGVLWAESEGKDKGTTFYVEIPIR